MTMRGRRGTLQPVSRAGGKSPTLFAPSRTQIDAIAPSNSFSVADTILTSTDRIDMHRAGQGESSQDESSSSASSSSAGTSSPASSTTSQESHQSLIYSLQDENADLRKEIQSLEIVLRDHGFAKNGKQIIPVDEIVRVENDHDEEGNPRARMEMVSMMGMDPERPTVLTKYLEFKVNELEDDLDKMEYERDRFVMMVKNLTSEASAKEAAQNESLKNSRDNKRKLEEKLANAMKLSKTRDCILAEKVDDLEENLDASYRKEEKLLERITELEKALKEKTDGSSSSNQVPQLEAKIELLTNQEHALKEQIAALENNLEFTVEESNKREKKLRGKINALETNLEWNIDNSARREDFLHDKISELEKSDKTRSSHERDIQNNENENDTLTIERSDVVTDEDDTLTFERSDGLREDQDTITLETNMEKSLTQEDLVGDFLEPFKRPTADAFQQSISEISKYHNERLEQWKREESKEREEQLLTKIAALETNLEWNMNESKKQERIFEEQLRAQERDLELNIEESTKQKARLQKRIDELESKREEGSLNLDSLVPPDDVLEIKKQLEGTKQQKQKLEEWLSRVVRESKKREKNFQAMISKLEASNKTSMEREDLLKSRVAVLEAQAEELKTETIKQDNLQNLYESALHKEFEKQDIMAQEISDLKQTLKTNDGLHKAQQEELLSKMNELAEALEEDKSRNVDADKQEQFEKKNERYLSCISVLEEEIAELRGTLQRNNELHADQQNHLLSRINQLAPALEEERRKNKNTSTSANDSAAEQLTNVYSRESSEELKTTKTNLEKALRQNEVSTRRIVELENDLESYRKEKFAQNKRITKLQGDMDEITQKNEELLETIMELEIDLQDEQQEKLDVSEKCAKLEGDVENLTIQQAPIAAINDRLEKEAEDFRKNEVITNHRVLELQNQVESYRMEKFSKNKKVANLQSDMEEIAMKNEELSETVMELESDLEYERKEKFERIKLIAELQSELEFLQQNNNQEGVVPIEEESVRSMRSARSRRIFEVENELASYRKEKFAQNKKMAKLQIDMDEIAQKNEGLLETIMQLESDLEYEQQEKNERNKRIATLQSELENAVMQNTPIDSSSAHSEKSAGTNGAERKDLIKRLAKLQAEHDQTSKLFKSMTAHNRNLEIEHEALKAERERLNNRIELLVGDGPESSPKTFRKTPESSLKSFLQAELTTAKGEKDRLRKCIEDLTKQLEESKSRSNTEQESLHKCIEELTAKLEESTSKSKIEKERLGQRIEELTKELKENVAKSPENSPEPERTEATAFRNKPLVKLRNKVVAELKNEIENRQRIVELADLKKEFVESSIVHKTREEELSTRIEALETELEFGQHEHERLERVIYVIRNELRMAAENIEPTLTRNKGLEEELESKNAEQASLMKQVDDLKAELQSSSKTFNNNILDLKMKLKLKQSEFEHLNEFKHELEAALEEMTKKVENIETEFEAASKTMDSTYEELSAHNIATEKLLVSYKTETKYLSKFTEELQKELAEKLNVKRDVPLSVRRLRELRRKESMKKKSSELINDEELLESEHLNHSSDDLIESEHQSPDKSLKNEDSDEELQMSGKTSDDLENSSSSSSKPSGKGQRERLTSEILDIEKKLEREKATRDSLKTKVAELEEEKSQIKLENKPTNALTAQIRESEAELEVINASIYELEADLEDLLDELWDYDRGQESDTEEEQQDLDRVGSLDNAFHANKNRERLSRRVVELEKDMEELEDELEETIERSKEQRQKLVFQNTELEKKLDATKEKAAKEKQAFTFRITALEKELEETIEKSRKDQQVLAIHYIEKEREVKETSKKADIRERRLKSEIATLEKERNSHREGGKGDKLFSSLAVLLDDMEAIDGSNNAAEGNHSNGIDNSTKKLSESNESLVNAQEHLVAMVSDLKKKYIIKLDENKVLNEVTQEIEAKLQHAQEKVLETQKEVEDLNSKYTKLESKWKSSDEEHEHSIWEAEQKMRDLIDTASLERKEKKRFQDESKKIKQDLETLQKENEKLNTMNEAFEAMAKEERDKCETLRHRISNLEEEIRSASTEHDIVIERLSKEGSEKLETFSNRIAELEKEIQSASSEHDIEKERFMSRIKNLQKQLEDSAREKESLSAQIESHEKEKKEHAVLSHRFGALEKELQSTIEESNRERKLHLELKKRLVEITMKNQADRANFDNRLFKLKKELEKCHKEKESLSSELKFFEAEKNQLNVSGILGDDLRSTFEENDNIFRTIESYERGTSNDRTATDNAVCDEDTLPSNSGAPGIRKPTPFRVNGALVSAPLLVEVANLRSNISEELHRRRIDNFLSPLVKKADEILGQEIPRSLVKGVQNSLLLRAEEVACENVTWEAFESIVEEVCQEYDQDTWFDIQEAFFVAWEEIEIQKIEEN